MSDDQKATELGAFLRARRRDVHPDEVGLPDTGHRRVPGLRREEVALLASISTDYYTRIEQGRRPASEAALEAIARVLRLNEDERRYAFELARSATRRVATQRSRRPRVPAGVLALMDAMASAPALLQNGRLDVLGANSLGKAVFADVLDGERESNLARFVFFDPRASDLFVEWDAVADDAVTMLRVEAGRAPYDKALTDLIGELATRSDEFRLRWAAHEVRGHRRGSKRLHHRDVGELTLHYEALEIPDSGGLVLYGYTAEAGSVSEQSLRLLASWTAGATTLPSSAQQTRS